MRRIRNANVLKISVEKYSGQKRDISDACSGWYRWSNSFDNLEFFDRIGHQVTPSDGTDDIDMNGDAGVYSVSRRRRRCKSVGSAAANKNKTYREKK